MAPKRLLFASPALALLGLHCASLTGLDGHVDALRAVCDRVGDCSGTFDTALCYEARQGKISSLSTPTVSTWIGRFDLEQCADDCVKARLCLDDPLFCTERGFACDETEDCCDYSKGYAKCGRVDALGDGFCCRTKGAPCQPGAGTDACCSSSGGCDAVTYTCGGVVCAPFGSGCTADQQCCSGFCGDDGTCGLPCQADGFTCSEGAQCCSNFCDLLSGGRCATPTCGPNGTACAAPDDCCSGVCFFVLGDGVCADDQCFPEGSDCIIPDNCCPVGDVRFCDPELHACGACRPSGQPCVLDASCCSGTCSVTGGVNGACT